LKDLRKEHLVVTQLPERLSTALSPILLVDCVSFGIIVTTQIFLAIVILDAAELRPFVWDAAYLLFNSVICAGRLVHTCLLTASLEDEVL
jgi:hypothetical protein